MNRAEKYFKASLVNGGPSVECFYLLGCASFGKGETLLAAERFKKAFHLNPDPYLCNDTPFEELLLIPSQLFASPVMQYSHTRDYSLTSNGLPYSTCCLREVRSEDSSLGREIRRFEKLPPISAQDIKNVNLDELLKALIGKPM